MRAIKHIWFPAAVILLVGVIGYNVLTVVRLRQAGDDSAALPAASQAEQSSAATALSAGNGAAAQAEPDDREPAPKVRTVAFFIKPQSETTGIERSGLSAGLKGLDAVRDVSVDEDSLRVTAIGSLRLSQLDKVLRGHEATVAADKTVLRGPLRLHVSGMT